MIGPLGGGMGLLDVDVAVEDDVVVDGDDVVVGDDELEDELDEELDDDEVVDGADVDDGSGSVGRGRLGRAAPWPAVCGAVVVPGRAKATVAIIASAAVRVNRKPVRDANRAENRDFR